MPRHRIGRQIDLLDMIVQNRPCLLTSIHCSAGSSSGGADRPVGHGGQAMGATDVDEIELDS